MVEGASPSLFRQEAHFIGRTSPEENTIPPPDAPIEVQEVDRSLLTRSPSRSAPY